MRPEEVLDAQGDLLDRLRDVRFAKAMGAMFTVPAYQDDDAIQAIMESNVNFIQTTMVRGARDAYTFKVSHDLGMLVEHAADQLDGTDLIDLRLPPTECGFVSFDRPFPQIDQRGRTMLAHFLLWVPSTLNYGAIDSNGRRTEGGLHSGISLFWLNDMWRQTDDVDAMMRESLPAAEYEKYRTINGRFAIVAHEHLTAGQRLGPSVIPPSPEMAAAILAQEGTEARKGTNAIRTAHALWLLMDQTLARKDDADLPRPTRRRAEKRRMPGKVTVVRLRREEQAGRQPGESDIEWAYRWIVRGYWRWQPVGEYHPRAQEFEPGVFKARVYVSGHVKGPEGKPFKVTEKVYSLDR